MLAHRIELDRHTTAGKLAHSLIISPQTMVNHLRDSLGMKSFHLRWVPQMPSDSQKADRVSSAREMIWIPNNNAEQDSSLD
jgi:hypothetical protein